MKKMFLYIARRFKDVSEQCSDFGLLQGRDIGKWLISKELIASEFEKYKAVKKWVLSAGEDSRESYLEDLMTHVRFELMNRFLMNTVLDDSGFLPRKVLAHALQRSLCIGLSIPGLDVYYRHKYYNYQLSPVPGATFGLAIGKLESEFLIKPMAPFFFTFYHWCMSARVELHDAMYLVLQFEQRFFSKGPLQSLAEDVSSSSFHGSTRLVAEIGSVPCTRQFNQLAAEDNILYIKIIDCMNLEQLKVSYGEAQKGSLSLLFNIQCKSRK